MLALALATVLLFVSRATAQGSTTAFLENNATTARRTTLVLQVTHPLGTPQGIWYKNTQPIAIGGRTRQDVSGTTHLLNITDVQDSDAGYYFYIAAGRFSQGYVTVVPNVINGGFGPWGPWRSNSECSVTCGGGTRLATRIRVCDNPLPQYGGINCTETFLDSTNQSCNTNACPAAVSGLCESAVTLNGVGYRYHPTDCDKYIQCYYNPNGDVLGVYRSCPFGYYWNNATYKCDEYWNVKNCPVEKCSSSCGLSFKISGSCGSYWQCGEMGPEAMFCPQGLTFYQGRGCRRNPDCDDVCPSMYISRETCMKRMTWDNVSNYEVYGGNLGWRQMQCPPGTFFDIGDCGCKARNNGTCQVGMSLQFATSTLPSSVTSSNVNIAGGFATFNNQSSMTLDVSRMPTTCPKVIQLRYREDSTSTTLRVLASTTDSKNDNSIVLSYNNDALHFSLTSWSNNVDTVSLSTAGMRPNEWKTVTIYYDNHHLVGIVNTDRLKNRARIYAPGLTMMENKILIGTDGTNVRDKHFFGSIDFVSLYNCDAGFLY